MAYIYYKMQSYQAVINKNDNLKKIDYILTDIFKNDVIKRWKINSDSIELLIFIFKNANQIKIFYEKNKPTFMIADFESSNSQENNFCDKINSLNLQIDSYENLEDLVYDTVQLILKYKDSVAKIEKFENQIKPKDINIFKEEIEKYKSEAKIKIKSSTVLSSNSIIEMLGDQIIKLYLNNNYTIEMKNLQEFTIAMSNFKIKNSENNICSDLKIFANIKIPDDITSKPPTVSLQSNYIFKNNILNVIEKLKPFTDVTKWSIKYSIFDTIENIYQMIEKYGNLDSKSKSELDGLLTELEYLLSIKSDNVSENKLLLEFDELLANELAGFVDKKNNYWKTGTGYGHNGSSTWNIDEYAKAIQLRKNKIIDKFNDAFKLIDKITKLEVHEIEKLKNIFKHYMLDDELNSKIVENIASVISNNNKHFSENTFITTTVKSIKEYLVENNIMHPINEIIKNIDIVETNLDEFQKIFNQYKFKYYDEEFNSFHYSKEPLITLNSNQVSRLQKEFQILKKSITLHKDASIFFCIQKNNVNKIRFMISGPKDTPYEFGLFIFDMTMPNEFPSGPPHVNFSNNGGKRFNPNLYDSGKVCLSLLGTWRGDKGESWNSATSTFNQLLISIQSQILIDEPYFNEPGYEKSIGTESGQKMSKEYNYNIRQYTLDHTMIDLLLNNKYQEFKDIIKNYFKFQKTNIIKTLNKWLEEMPSSRTVKFQESYNKFVNLVDKL